MSLLQVITMRRAASLKPPSSARVPVSFRCLRSLLSRQPSQSRRCLSQLQQRSTTSFQPSSPLGNATDPQRLTDAEWEMRVGRAIYVLTGTLSDFFASGLIMNVSHNDTIDIEESIYSRDIVLSYRPPTRLPPPFPETLRIQGLSLYQGSAVLLKSSFTTLYSDCNVTLERMSVLPCGPRERKVRIDLNLHGTARLSSTTSAWNVSSTYHFSPSSGLIYRHDIESIYPEPHSAVFESMQNTLLRLTGIKPRTPEEAGNLEGLKVPIHSRDHTSYPLLRPRRYR